MIIETGKTHKRTADGVFWKGYLAILIALMLTGRPTGKAVPAKEEVARGDNAEVDWTGLVGIPIANSFG